MSLNRYAKRRDETEPDIVKGLEKCGVQVLRQDFPDLVARRAGVIYLLEVDGITENRKRSPEQLEFLREWQIPRVKNLDDALAVVGLRPTRLATSVSCTSKPRSTPTSSVGAR